MHYVERITQKARYPMHALATMSPRKLLFSVNLLLAVCSVCVAGFSIYLCHLLYDPQFVAGWFNWLGMAVAGLGIFIIAILGMRGAHLVSLKLLLTYFWLIFISLTPLLLGLFACFNISFYTQIWFKHSWELGHFLAIREIFCRPSSTASNKCIAPLYGGENTTITQWCIDNYNATDCQQIRDDAISRAVDFGGTIINTQSFIGIAEAIIILLSIYVAQKILTSPVITQSMMDVINYILLFPIAGCVALTIYCWWLNNLNVSYNWLPWLFLALGVAQVVALPLGILSGRFKSRIWLSIYIALMVLIVMGLATAGALGWTMAKVMSNDYRPSSDIIASIACRKTLPGCSGCDLDPPTCNEWGSQEVLTLVSLDLRLAGMVMILSILYILGGLVVGILVENSLKNYKTDSI